MVADGNVAQFFTINAAAKTRHPETERIENCSEETVHLVAPAATPALHHLDEGGCRGDRGRPSHERIQRLPGEGHEVSTVQSRQAVKVERNRPVDPDPCEIGIQLAGCQDHSVFV